MDNNKLKLWLDYLAQLFPGQLVLYAPELSVVLGKTEKALRNLISRGMLPFQLKKLGGRNCVDIIAVAQWLASEDEDVPTDSSVTSATQKKAAGKSAARPRKGRGRVGHQVKDAYYEALTNLSRRSLILSDAEAEFVNELVERLLAPVKGPDVPLIARRRSFLDTPYGVVRAEVKMFVSGSVQAAIGSLQYPEPDLLHATLDVRYKGSSIYRSYTAGGEWIVVLDKLHGN